MQEVREQILERPTLHWLLRDASQRFEALLKMHLASNRAMHEMFMQRLEVHDMTKEIFIECVEMMRAIQKEYLLHGSFTDAGAFSAAQLLVTIDYNFVLRAMPALPQSHAQRHHLIADVLKVASKR